MKTRIISIILYVVSALMVLTGALFLINQLYDIEEEKTRKSAYSLSELNYYFIEGYYEQLVEKVAYNKALKLTGDETKDIKDYYIFADWYEELLDYEIYNKSGDTKRAQLSMEKMQELEKSYTHQIFKEKTEQIKKMSSMK